MCRDWIKQDLLSEGFINKYKDDYAAQQKFNRDHQLKKSSSFSVYANIITILLSILVFIIGNSYDVDINVLITIIVILIVGDFAISSERAQVRAELTRRDIPAICSECQNIMYCYRYIDGVNDFGGIVYLCHDCNTKFIYSEPFPFSVGLE